MLFIIATDVLQRMVQAVNTRLPYSISARIHESVLALQYADDTALIAKVEEDLQAIIVLKIILRIFTRISGLSINYEKSCFVQFNVIEEQSLKIEALLGCPKKHLPITYLRMPLTIKRPRRDLYIPLIDKIEGKTCEGKRMKNRR
ncbi:uncharacterized protein LOC144551852 [Carex rostrata]